MRTVVQNDKSRAPRGVSRVSRPALRGARRRALRRRAAAATAVLTVAALAAGCAQDDTAGVRGAAGQQAPPARALDGYAAELRAAQAARAAAAKRWDLKKVPLTAPSAPAKKPRIKAREGFEVDGQETDGLPPVFTTVPTKEKVVFLTIDDGAEKDPAFLKMMSELKIPYTAFLTDEEIKDDYGYFKKMQARGVTLNNHTLSHPYLPALSYKEQKREICGMQDVMEKHYGKRPVLFRPPFGNYNGDTLRAAKSCGIKYAPIWSEEVYVDHWEYREWDQDLHPGDIVLTHFRGTDDWDGSMTDMVRRFLDRITADGYAVARLEDYL
ncbi:polysaccharide deacetylase family protein [Streptomyces olivaceus]|uniref:polysaccharide deacetylase family protein n=1 Tax=Streptomyces olivaceus TaxID=47716 RepID=UPI00099FB7FA|nr:polysaccharide deacetylase family protein [Streptomyces olivaceus]MBZ6303791.1 polysaccharide deacetylase family protein [Streptomyces olivaceus]MBZ6317350.1 polysaccharide deacetylase family protein [Streptomyces olivaceus]